MTEKIQPELRDIIEMLNRFNASNKNNTCFIWSTVAFKKETGTKCDCCGDECDTVNDEASRFGAYGDKETLRIMINDLRDLVEDCSDEDGFVNV